MDRQRGTTSTPSLYEGHSNFSACSSMMLRSFPVCLSSFDEDMEIDTSSGLQSSLKPAIWNSSYRNRIKRVANDFDHSLYAAQDGLGGCDAHDSSVSRRAFLKSLVHGRMKGISDTTALGGGGDDGIGGKGFGGSGGDGFGFDGLGGEDGFFIAGMGSWVLIGSAFCLLISLFAQIFRGAGSTPSHNKGTVNRTNGSESDGLRTGSLSHGSRGVRYNRSPDRDPTPSVFQLASICFAAAECDKIHFRGHISQWLGFFIWIKLGLFTGTLYPSACIQPKAFYRGLIGSVGAKPGDWVETVNAEGDNHYATVDASITIHQRSLDTVIDVDSKEPMEPVQEAEDLNAMMDQLMHVQHLLKQSEIKRTEALEDLKDSNVRNESKRKTLLAKIKTQEAQNKKVNSYSIQAVSHVLIQIRARLEQIHKERDSLVQILGDARGTLDGVLPHVEESSGQIDDLNKAVKTHKTNLRLLEKQLTVTSRERDAVLRRMESLQRDVNDIESLLDIVEKSRDLVAHCEDDHYTDRIQKAESCIQVLQQYLLRPTGGRQLSPIREVGNRIVVVFEKMMVELKRGFIQTSKYLKQLEAIQEKLSQNSQDEATLGHQLIESKAQFESLKTEKANIEATLIEMQHTLATAQENLDGNSKTEIELRGAMETLTCEKDTLSAMMRSIQREVEDIESLTQIMEKTRELITQTPVDQMGVDQVSMLENCMNVLQQHHLKPTEPYDHVSRNISDRLVRVFENFLTQTKQSIIKAMESKGTLKKVEGDIERALSEESSLTMTIESLKDQLNDMSMVKTSLSNDVQLLKNELDEKTVSLDQLRMELTNLDEVREEQNKDIEKLKDELAEKRKLLETSKQAEVDMTETLAKISEERDLLQSKLQLNEDDLSGLRQQLESVLAEGKEAQEQLDALQAEKSNLETQLSGLTHRIKDFESENSRLNAVAQTLKSNLDHERRAKEQLEQEAEDTAAEKADLHVKFMGEIETLKGRLEDAHGDCKRLEETCETLEEAKTRLESLLKEESHKYDEQMEKLKKTYEGDPVLAGSADSEPIRQPEYQESPFAQADPPEPSRAVEKDEGSPVMAHTAEASSQIQPAEEADVYGDQGDSRLLHWLDEADVDPWGVMPEGRDTNTAPPYESESSQVLGNLMPNAGPICERKIHRRLSWPQDMTFALNDNLLGAAQELVDMTTATLELAAEKNQLESELNEVRQAINEARAQLEEREAEVSDLTEHFLQVYQIASDLAADNEDQSSELRDLRMTYERQKQDIESRDRRIAMLETEFAMHNMAPPPNSIVKNHFSEPLGNFPASAIVEPTASSFANSDYDDGHGRLRSISSLGIHPGEMHGMTSPRFEAPGTPSMISTTMDLNAPRAHSSATMTSVATKNYEEADGPSVHYSIDELSSLSGADDESDSGYPDADHYPIRMDMV